MTEGWIKEINRFSTVDGEGIRSMIYLLGCHLRCAWCSSPLTWQQKQQVFIYREKCVKCGRCVECCPTHALSMEGGKLVRKESLCSMCGQCTRVCPQEAITLVGQKISAAEAAEQLSRDALFYEESGGGVTISGGEPLLQLPFVDELIGLLHDAQINVALETSLNFAWDQIQNTVLKADSVLVDLKTMDMEKAKEYTGQSLRHVQDNIRELVRAGRPPSINFPVVPGWNDDKQTIERMISFLEDTGLSAIRLLPFHRLGVSEYDGLCLFDKARTVQNIPIPSPAQLQEIVTYFHVSLNGIIYT